MVVDLDMENVNEDTVALTITDMVGASEVAGVRGGAATAPPQNAMARESEGEGLLYRDVGPAEVNYNKAQLWKALM